MDEIPSNGKATTHNTTYTNAHCAESKTKFNPKIPMTKDLFTDTPDLSAVERENQLKASCYPVDAEFTFDRPFTPEEKERKTRELIELMDEIDTEADAIKAEVKLRRQTLKDLDKQVHELEDTIVRWHQDSAASQKLASCQASGRSPPVH